MLNFVKNGIFTKTASFHSFIIFCQKQNPLEPAYTSTVTHAASTITN